VDDTLLRYYERELSFLREMGAQFARKYPKIAGRLLLEPDRCEDPHTERLIEAFALIAGRIHRKIDDGFPEITESLFHILHPHYINPIPSMTVVRFDPVKQTVGPPGFVVEKGTQLYSKPVGGAACQFAVAFPVTILPVEVRQAGVQEPRRMAQGARQDISIGLETLNAIDVSRIQADKLRFYLNGSHQSVFALYELLFNHVTALEIHGLGSGGSPAAFQLPPGSLKQVGFEDDEALIPATPRSFPGYLRLLEYFTFPEKYLFFDIAGLSSALQGLHGTAFEIRISIDRPVPPGIVIDADTFCLNAAPAVNLFRKTAEPIRLDRRSTEYRVIPDLRRQDATEVYHVERVVSAAATDPSRTLEIRPLYSLSHHEAHEGPQVFWHMRRVPSPRKGDNGTDVYLSFTDAALSPADPGVETVTVSTVCTNRDLPGRLPFGDPSGDFTMESPAPLARISCLVKPTQTRRPGLQGALQWRLISHLSLNHLSLVSGGADPLKEILSLYDFEDSPSTRQQISGIVGLDTRHVTRRVKGSFCRGLLVRVTFDEDKFVGSSMFLLASVLERFLAHYVSINSFVQLEALSLQRRGAVRLWPPRNGNRILA